jgi:hypothetical protein
MWPIRFGHVATRPTSAVDVGQAAAFVSAWPGVGLVLAHAHDDPSRDEQG